MRRFDQNRHWEGGRDFQDSQYNKYQGQRHTENRQHWMRNLEHRYGNMNIDEHQQHKNDRMAGTRSNQRTYEQMQQDAWGSDNTQRYDYNHGNASRFDDRHQRMMHNYSAVNREWQQYRQSGPGRSYQNEVFQGSRFHGNSTQNRTDPSQQFWHSNVHLGDFNRSSPESDVRNEYINNSVRDNRNLNNRQFQIHQHPSDSFRSFGADVNSAHFIPGCHGNTDGLRRSGKGDPQYGRNETENWTMRSKNESRDESKKDLRANRMDSPVESWSLKPHTESIGREGSYRSQFLKDKSEFRTREQTSSSREREISNLIVVKDPSDGMKLSDTKQSSSHAQDEGHKHISGIKGQGQTDRSSKQGKDLSTKGNSDEKKISQEKLSEKETGKTNDRASEIGKTSDRASVIRKTSEQASESRKTSDKTSWEKVQISDSDKNSDLTIVTSSDKGRKSSGDSSNTGNQKNCSSGSSRLKSDNDKKLDKRISSSGESSKLASKVITKFSEHNEDASRSYKSKEITGDNKQIDNYDKSPFGQRKKSVEGENSDRNKMPQLKSPISRSSEKSFKWVNQTETRQIDFKRCEIDNDQTKESSWSRQEGVRRRILESGLPERSVCKPYTFQVIKDNGMEDEEKTGGSDLDIDDSDDDDELEQPSFLSALEEASNRPIPGTPTKFSRLDVSQSSIPDSPQLEEENQIQVKKTTLKTGFSLDYLLSEKTDKPQEQKEFEEIHAELKEGLKKGGFVVDTLEEVEDTTGDELLPEHQVKLQNLQVSQSTIRDVHPGEEIFSPQRYRQIFTQSLGPQACGFVPGSTYIDNYLSAVQPDNYMSLLSSDILKMCFDNVSCPDAVCRWLYYIMSIHTSHLVINGCCDILEDHLNNQLHYTSTNSPTWSPTATDLLLVLLNCGASLDTLLPDTLGILGMDDLKSSVQVLNQGNDEDNENGLQRYNRENLRLTIRVLALCLQARPKHSPLQLTCMLMMLCKAALDQSLNNFMLTYEIQVCIASLLLCYSADEWKSQAPYLCKLLSSLTKHHHNIVYLGQLFPHGIRGGYIQRRICYVALRKIILSQETSLKEIDDFELNNLKILMPKLRELAGSNLNKQSTSVEYTNLPDLYQLASALSLLDMCVGNGIIKLAEKDDLQVLADQLKKITGDVRDNVRTLDRTRVKDIMVRIASKWTLVLLTVGSKQRSIFAYYPNKQQQEVHIETVQATQSDHESDQSSDSEEMDMNNEKRSMSKLNTKNSGNEIEMQSMDAGTSAENVHISNEQNLTDSEMKNVSVTDVDASNNSCDADIDMQDELPEL